VHQLRILVVNKLYVYQKQIFSAGFEPLLSAFCIVFGQLSTISSLQSNFPHFFTEIAPRASDMLFAFQNTAIACSPQ
jgi:hypothetical protein